MPANVYPITLGRIEGHGKRGKALTADYVLEYRNTKLAVIEAISTHFNSKQEVFLDFVLSHYVSVGVEELDQAKLTPLLRLKYHDSIADAVADLGKPEEIGKVFTGFQKYLYQVPA